MNTVRTIPAIVRAFFSAFVEGVIEGSITDVNQHMDVTPKQLKQLLVEHYEEVSQHLFRVCFHPLAMVCYSNPDTLEAKLRNPAVQPTLTPQKMLELACGGEEMCSLMIEEYRRNFYAILSGRVMSVEEYFDGIDTKTIPARMGNIPEERAIRALVITIRDAFRAGRSVMKADERPVNQIYIYRLLEDNMQCLMHDAPLHIDDDADLNQTFLAVCGSLENMNTMLTAVGE